MIITSPAHAGEGSYVKGPGFRGAFLLALFTGSCWPVRRDRVKSRPSSRTGFGQKRPPDDFNRGPFFGQSLKLNPRLAQSLNAALKYLGSSVGQYPPPPFQ
jgi:hypothetical protein